MRPSGVSRGEKTDATRRDEKGTETDAATRRRAKGRRSVVVVVVAMAVGDDLDTLIEPACDDSPTATTSREPVPAVTVEPDL